ERERVQPPRHNHQVGKAQLYVLRSWQALACFLFLNTSLEPFLTADACGTHTGQRPSRLVARAVRSAIGASGQRSCIIDPDDRFAVALR
ncbi:hypothetical protein, partial [Rhizobium leguminosarum]|uniref:hypothetical protein n=1 Tax=Rhizobium leguminosarum TaxID=384 RepID=UPI003D0431D2